MTHRRAPLALPAAILAAVLAACGDGAVDPGGPDALLGDAEPPFRTDSLAYTMRSGEVGRSAMIVATYVNRGPTPTYFVNCNGATGVALQKRVGPRWVHAWSPVMPACLSGPIVVPPGGSHEFLVHLFDGSREHNTSPRFTTDIPGTYRLVWYDAQGRYDTGPDASATLPRAARLSNHFTLDVEPR